MRILTPKLQLALVFAVLSMLGTPLGAAEESPFAPKYPFDTAILHSEFGGIQSGKGTTWIDGEKMARHEKRTTTVMGMGQTQEQWTIQTPESIIVWEVGKPTAMRSDNPAGKMREEYEKLSASEQEVVRRNSQKLGNVFMGGMGGGTQTKGEYLGYPVDIIEVMGTKQYLLAGTPLLLKQEGGMAGMEIKETVTKIEKDVPIPADKFELPPEVKVVPNPAGDMATNMSMGTFEALKDPNFEEKMKAARAQGAAGAPGGMPDLSGMAQGGEGQPDPAEMMKAMEQMMKAMQNTQKK